MKKKWFVSFVIVICMIVILLYTGIQRRHTFTLADRGSTKVKQEQIQPLFGTVKVSGDCDTDVVFTDIETGERYIVGYITSGVSEKIQLQKGKWYTVDGFGNVTVSPVNVRTK